EHRPAPPQARGSPDHLPCTVSSASSAIGGLSHVPNSNPNSLHFPHALMRCGPEWRSGRSSVESLRRREWLVASQRNLRTHSHGSSGLRRCCSEISGCYHLTGTFYSGNLSQRRVISLDNR